MSKKLTLVVHGIGEQAPGETLDSLSAALVQNRSFEVSKEQRDLYDQTDPVTEARARQFKSFPCYSHQVTAKGYSNRLAEVYWADLSRGGTSALSTLFDMFRTILGLGYIAIASAEEEYLAEDDKERRFKPLLAITHLVTHLMHGPIATIAVILSLHAVTYFLAKTVIGTLSAGLNLLQIDFVVPVLTAQVVGLFMSGGLAFFAARFAWSRYRNYLFRVFLKWLHALGAATVLMGIVLALVGGNVLSLAGLINSECTGIKVCAEIILLELGTLASNIFWLVSMLGVLVIFIWAFFRTETANLFGFRNDTRPLVAETTALMTIMMSAMLSIISVTAVNLLQKFGAWDANFDPFMDKTIGTAIVTLAMIGILACAALIILGKRSAWKKHHADMELAKVPSSIPRIIVNKTLSSALYFGSLCILCAVALLVMIHLFILFGVDDPNDSGSRLLAFYARGYDITAAIAVTVGTAYLSFWSRIGMVIGVLKDIVGYFAYEQVKDSDDVRYNIRDAVNERLLTVLQVMVAQQKPDELVIVSHSQGTVIALEVLADPAFMTRIGAPKGMKTHLVTMGSPTHYIYGHYFARKFQFQAKAEQALEHLESWTNIYRIDDFVGLDLPILDAEKQMNYLAPAKGHTGYWADPIVRPVLVERVFPEFA